MPCEFFIHNFLPLAYFRGRCEHRLVDWSLMKGCMAPDRLIAGAVHIRFLRGNMNQVLSYWSASYSLSHVSYLTVLVSVMFSYCVCRSALDRGLQRGEAMPKHSLK